MIGVTVDGISLEKCRISIPINSFLKSNLNKKNSLMDISNVLMFIHW